MRADNALSHLHNGEECIAITQNGKRKVVWNKQEWCFQDTESVRPVTLPFEDIVEWHPASIRID